MQRRRVGTVVLTSAAFAVGAAAFGASTVQRSDGGSWLHGFLSALVPIGLLMLPVTAAELWLARAQRDGMPAYVWAPLTVPGPRAELRCEASRLRRFQVTGAIVLTVAAAPFFLYVAARDAPGPTIFVVIWIACAAAAIRWTVKYGVDVVTLGADDVLHADGPRWARSHRDVPVSDVRSVAWPPAFGGYVVIAYAGGTLSIASQMEHLDELVVELRRRNREIRYEGRWPPRRS